MPATETLTLTVSPNIIKHLIESQAGTLGKAFVECIMNSVDAGATRVDITVDRDGYTIADDGHGFRSREEILACFNVFGFEHTDRERTFGKFGLGRAQLWNWSRTAWRTHAFEFSVDIRARGLDYDLVRDLADQPGLTITGTFYEPLSEVDKTALLNEIDTLCKYAVVPVSVNGRDVRRDPASMTWTHEDDRVWIKQTQTSTLAVYNQGIFVRKYNASQIGIGGTLITKRGHDLALNMSRSDVLTHKCPLWKDLRALCSTMSAKETSKRTTRMTVDQRDYLASQCTDPAQVENLCRPIFTLSNGKNITLLELSERTLDTCLTVAARGDRMADVALQEKTAVVLAEETLARFNVSTPTELVEALIGMLGNAGAERRTRDNRASDLHLAAPGLYYAYNRLRLAVERHLVIDAFKDTPAYARANSSIVPKAKLNPVQTRCLNVLADLNRAVTHHVNWKRRESGGTRDCDLPERDVCVGRSNCAEAFTDGATYIAIEEDVLHKAVGDGAQGWLKLMALLVHENLHDADDSSGHEHDHAFFELFHDVMQDCPVLYGAAIGAFRDYCKRVERVSRRQAAQLDAIGTAGSDAAPGVMVPALAAM